MAAYQLSIGQRLTLLQLLPEKGNYVTLKVVDEVRRALALSDEELERADVRQTGEMDFSDPPRPVPEGLVVWNMGKDFTKEVEISRTVRREIEKVFQKMDETEELTPAMLPLYEIFMDENGSEDTPVPLPAIRKGEAT